MIICIIIAVTALLVGGWFTLRALTNAGEGYQDDFGFHSGALSPRRQSKQKKRRSVK